MTCPLRGAAVILMQMPVKVSNLTKGAVNPRFENLACTRRHRDDRSQRSVKANERRHMATKSNPTFGLTQSRKGPRRHDSLLPPVLHGQKKRRLDKLQDMKPRRILSVARKSKSYGTRTVAQPWRRAHERRIRRSSCACRYGSETHRT